MKQGWKFTRLSEVCHIKPPKRLAREMLCDDDLVSFVPMENLGILKKELELRETRQLRDVAGSYTYFADGDVLLAKITPCFENGKIGIASGLTNGVGFGSSEFVVLRSAGEIDPEYLFYFLSQDSFRKHGSRVMSGAVGHKRVPKEFIEELMIPLPPLPEQKLIVAILDEAFTGIDEAVANTEKNLANARELFESYLNSLFIKKGEGWTEKILREIIDITHGYAFKGPDFEVSDDVSKPIVLTPGNYTEDATLDFNPENTKRLSGFYPSEYLFEAGELTVVMTDLSSKMKILGKPAFIDKPNVLHNQRIGRVIFKDDSVYHRFLYYFLQTRTVLDEIKSTATGTMVRHTAPKRILCNKIPLPAKRSEQAEIVSSLDDLRGKTNKLEEITAKKLMSLDELKQSLLHKAYNGELTKMPEKDLRKSSI